MILQDAYSTVVMSDSSADGDLLGHVHVRPAERSHGLESRDVFIELRRKIF